MRNTLKIAVLWVTGAFLAFSAAALAAKPDAADVRKELAVHYYRGVVNYEAGRFEDALNEFRAVSSIDPYYKDTQKYITQSMNRLEQYREDLLLPKDSSSYEAKGVDLYFLGKMYYEKRDYDRALEAFKAILDQNPGDKFALYYAELCEQALGPKAKKESVVSGPKSRAEEVMGMEKEISYIKEDISAKEDMDTFLEEKAQRRADRDEMIRKKERQLSRQEALLEEEKQGYLAEAKLAKKARKLDAETEKWRRMKDEISSRTPGIPAEIMEFPVYMNKAATYYQGMKDALRTSRWNSAGLNAIQASLYACDAVLIYYYSIKSAYPEHENIARLMADHIDREDAQENILRLRAILNMKAIMEDEDRPLTRSEALFLAEKTERLLEWCRAILP
ncbi:MAG: tetratricopeptide repeat protein [Candidatus Omnitrophota bacterium]|nr:tetratricopeptide repeat protein [Candidatus Omnitrophota bacterium]MDD5137920.1 tetratricopeptide repeat protein [Candidatus Omnitrophota bacterium]